VVRSVIAKAKAGEPWAIKELFDRLYGKAPQSIQIDTGGDDEAPATSCPRGAP